MVKEKRMSLLSGLNLLIKGGDIKKNYFLVKFGKLIVRLITLFV